MTWAFNYDGYQLIKLLINFSIYDCIFKNYISAVAFIETSKKAADDKTSMEFHSCANTVIKHQHCLEILPRTQRGSIQSQFSRLKTIKICPAKNLYQINHVLSFDCQSRKDIDYLQ